MSIDDGNSEYLSDDDSLTNEENESNSGTSTAQSATVMDERNEIQRMIRKESNDVVMWREIVTGMMVITGTLVTLATFILFSQLEANNFEDGFTDEAGNIIDASSFRIKTIEESLFGLGDVVSTFATASGAKWPFVSVPDFDLHARHVRTLTSLQYIWTAPSVDDQERADYVKFSSNVTNGTVFPDIFQVDDDGVSSPVEGSGPFLPVLQLSPFPPIGHPLPVNFDASSRNGSETLAGAVRELNATVVSGLIAPENLKLSHATYGTNASATGAGSIFVHPIFDSPTNQTMVGIMISTLFWRYLFENILDEDQNEFVCVLNTTCGDESTWLVNGQTAEYIGEGDLHDPRFEKHKIGAELPLYKDPELAAEAGACRYYLFVYPSATYRSTYSNNNPGVYAAVIGLVFLGLSCAFFLYDRFVQRRNDKVVSAAARSNKIVSSLFPAAVRDQLYAENESVTGFSRKHRSRWLSPKSGISDFLHEENENMEDAFMFETKPIADLFPECTILFADLVGFTAWSSVREPSQVFTLLETVYRAFDIIARRRKIFKVETVGDCYVAVSGLPEPRKDHAVAMSKFAYDCLRKIGEVTKKLEVALGPDTADLTVRVGLHSGPVTAGVLRGEKSRFQLFGDTMNTAARMESTGMPTKIQLSQETTDLLLAAGKGHWVTQREDKVIAKGKGEMQTYWLNLNSRGSTRSSSDNEGNMNLDERSDQSSFDDMVENTKENSKVQRLMGDKTSRLIDWNVDVLLSLLKQIVARRKVTTREAKPLDDFALLERQPESTVIDEVTEIIRLPEFDPHAAQYYGDADDVTIGEDVVAELLDYVTNIAIMYNENPFHCFDHASHVCMSVTKLMSRIVAPSDILGGISADLGGRRRNKLASNLHDHTYGITSDPLTQFACVFSALIHDVDHTGVPNTTLVKENASIATLYNNKSVAEQNSVDLAWELLTDDSYAKLRHTIYSTKDEQQRFRQLVVNSVMATDIMDKDLKALRNARWEKAFDPHFTEDSAEDSINRKATIVIEHLIQASDVAHTMQHWHIYRKWNERLFKENYLAYKAGRAEADPSVSWYQGEIGFFDFYIIPLANKLKDCGVFGVSSAEYLNYATVNRQEWEIRGQEIVSEMLEAVIKETSPPPQRMTLGSGAGSTDSQDGTTENPKKGLYPEGLRMN